jgi:hypothetical protein
MIAIARRPGCLCSGKKESREACDRASPFSVFRDFRMAGDAITGLGLHIEGDFQTVV